jgi:hypothetical protein
MRKALALLIGLLAAIGAATVVFFWRKNHASWNSVCRSAKDTAASWSKTAADEAGNAADKVAAMADGATSTASVVADQVKGSAPSSD